MKPRHTLELKRNVIRKRMEGTSLRDLATEFGLAKSTIQGWIHACELSEAAQNKVLAKGGFSRSLALARRRIALPTKAYQSMPSIKLTRFIAHTLFDGSIFNDQVVYYTSHIKLAQRFARDGQQLFDLKPGWGRSKNKIWRVHFYSKNLAELLREREYFLLATIPTACKGQKRAFLKAFFDDEGSVTFRLKDGKRVVRGYQKDITILKIIARLLCSFGISSKLENLNRYPEIVIRGRQEIEKFNNIVGFSSGVSFLSTRKNSYYHKPIEKQQVLQNLLSSYTS